jgi:uncharacterized membrane protein (DUF485 family)
MAKRKAVQKPVQSRVKPASKEKYFKDIKRKKHEAGWLALLKIGVVAFFIFVVLALAFGYGKTLAISTILLNGIQVGVLVIVLVVFIIGLITISENTSNEIKQGKAK